MMAIHELPVDSSELADVLDGGEASVLVPPSTAGNKKRKRPFLVPAIFIIGLILGWLVIGWWLWPVEWINAEPQNLSVEFQKVYIGLVASDYSLTGDVGRVQQILEKWNDDELTALLSDMIVSAASPEERQRLILLAEALTLPDTELSLTDVLAGQTLILVSAGVSIIFLGTAVAISLAPTIQKRARKRLAENDPQAIIDEVREELGEQIGEDEIFLEQPGTPPGNRPANDEPSELEIMVGAVESEVKEEEDKAAAEAESEEDGEEKEKGSLKAALDDEDDPYLILDDDEDEDEADGDPIFELFEEEDDSHHELDMLANPLPQIDMEDVLELSHEVITKFREYVRRPAR